MRRAERDNRRVALPVPVRIVGLPRSARVVPRRATRTLASATRCVPDASRMWASSQNPATGIASKRCHGPPLPSAESCEAAAAVLR